MPVGIAPVLSVAPARDQGQSSPKSTPPLSSGTVVWQPIQRTWPLTKPGNGLVSYTPRCTAPSSPISPVQATCLRLSVSATPSSPTAKPSKRLDSKVTAPELTVQNTMLPVATT